MSRVYKIAEIECTWLPKTLWDDPSVNYGLHKTFDGMWAVCDELGLGIDNVAYTHDEMLASVGWDTALLLIATGLPPDVIYSKHSDSLPDNNEGRDECAVCLTKTKKIQTFMGDFYSICNNIGCDYYGK